MACWRRLHLQFRHRWTSGRTSKSSNGRKIARMARNSTIFGPNESSRRDLFLEKFSKERNKQKVFKKFEKNSKKFSKNFSENFSKKKLKNFRIFRKLFVRFVRSKIFPEIGRAETIRLVQKSSNFEPSSRFFGRLKTESSETKSHSLYY